MWQELKRVNSLTETETTKNINRDSGIERFSVEGMKICIDDEQIKVECDEISYWFTKVEFNRRPRWVMERIFDLGRSVS